MSTVDLHSYCGVKQVFAYAEGSEILSAFHHLVTVLLIGVSVVSTAILILILALSIYGRMHEAGVLFSIGLPKRNIVAQFIMEVLCVAIIALVLSFPVSRFILEIVESGLFYQLRPQNLIEQVTFQHPDQRTAKGVLPGLNAGRLILLCGAQLGITALAVLASAVTVIRLKPRDILARIS